MSALATTEREALSLVESTTTIAPSGLTWPTQEIADLAQDPRIVPLHIIRPGIGRGRGRHLYEARMLEENAHKFNGWKMYVDHRSPEAKKKAGGLPRSLREAGGVIKEAWWDGTVPADPVKGYGQGAVVGLAKPTRMVRELIEDVPEFVEASISASATGVRPVNRGGQRVWLVEGIEDRGSVDWVTEAGAGGKVVSLMESLYEDADPEDLAELSNDEFIEYVRAARPRLLEALEATDSDDPHKEANMPGFTPEALLEALQHDDEVKSVIDRYINERVEERVATRLEEAASTGLTEDQIKELVESSVQTRIDSERDLIHAEAEARADRRVELRDLRDSAQTIIQESRLPDGFKARVQEKFTLLESGVPTPGLDVMDAVDEDGKIVKTAHAALREAVQEEIVRERELLASVNPTAVRGQGPGSSSKDGEQHKKSEGTYWGSVLQEAGVDPEAAYEG